MKEYTMYLWTEYTIWERSTYYVEANSAEEAQQKFTKAYDEGMIEADNSEFIFETLEYVGNVDLEDEDGELLKKWTGIKLTENGQ